MASLAPFTIPATCQIDTVVWCTWYFLLKYLHWEGYFHGNCWKSMFKNTIFSKAPTGIWNFIFTDSQFQHSKLCSLGLREHPPSTPWDYQNVIQKLSFSFHLLLERPRLFSWQAEWQAAKLVSLTLPLKMRHSWLLCWIGIRKCASSTSTFTRQFRGFINSFIMWNFFILKFHLCICSVPLVLLQAILTSFFAAMHAGITEPPLARQTEPITYSGMYFNSFASTVISFVWLYTQETRWPMDWCPC